MNKISFVKCDQSLQGQVVLPLSKSVNNRLQIIRFLQAAHCNEEEISSSRDSKILSELLYKIKIADAHTIVELNVEMAGTVLRFLTALLCIRKGIFVLIGHKRLTERPISPLVDTLRLLGANIDYLDKQNFLPIKIIGGTLESKYDAVQVDASVSSQFTSALLLIAPYIKNGLKLQLSAKVVSLPYIQMTLDLMKDAGAFVFWETETIHVKEGKYTNSIQNFEFDWSSASFFYQLCALSPNSKFTLLGLNLQSCQGDKRISDIFRNLGVESEQMQEGVMIRNSVPLLELHTIDFNSIPDLAIPVILSCALLPVNWQFIGLDNLIYKESNRIETLQSELSKMDIILVNKCGIYSLVKPTSMRKPIPIETHNDHRIAMGFAIMAAKINSIEIINPQVVDKSFPEFWQNMTKLGFEISHQ